MGINEHLIFSRKLEIDNLNHLTVIPRRLAISCHGPARDLLDVTFMAHDCLLISSLYNAGMSRLLGSMAIFEEEFKRLMFDVEG